MKPGDFRTGAGFFLLVLAEVKSDARLSCCDTWLCLVGSSVQAVGKKTLEHYTVAVGEKRP